MMPDNLREALLYYCLDELEAGVPLADILERFPDQANEIRPILEMALVLEELAGEPSAKAWTHSEEQFLDQAQQIQEKQHTPRPRKPWWSRLSLAFGKFAVAILVTLLLVSTSFSALPGEILYPVKGLTENLVLTLAPENQKQFLTDMFQHRHIDEIIILMETGGNANVQGKGYIEAIQGNTWTVYGIEMQITPGSLITGQPEIGAWAEVEGTVRDGQYFVRKIVILGESPPE